MRSVMTITALAALLPCVCFAGPKKDPSLVASLELPTIVTLDMRPTDAEAALPDAPEVPAISFSAEAPVVRGASHRISLANPEFGPAVSPIYSMPLVNTAMRLSGHHFNTDDGSSLNAFAICYRLNGRSSVQVIPGDPAPVKLPVASMKNNTGVTVGMVYRLSKRR